MKTNGPWKIKSTEEIYKNFWMKVREDKVVRPDGKDGIVGVVEAKDGISVLPIDDDGYVYLIEQFRYMLGENSIETVSGAIEGGENKLEAAKRELREEAGIVAEEWIELGTIKPMTTIIKSSNTIYLARNLQLVEATPEGTEQIKLLKVKFEEAVRMVMENKIPQGPSCVLILKAKEYLKSRN